MLRNQHGVAEGEFGFGDVAADEVGVGSRERVGFEALAREQQAGEAVHQQARAFGERDARGVTVVRAGLEISLRAEEQPVRRDEVVAEHADGLACEFGARSDLELDVRARRGRQHLPEHVEGARVAPLAGVAVAAEENVELEVVVGALAIGRG